MNRLVNRRNFIAAGLLAASSGLCGSNVANAGVLSSLAFPENEGLTELQITDRFASINNHYALGEAFSDTDVDFVLRYGMPVPGAVTTSSRTDGGLTFDLSVASEYVSPFAYEISSSIEVSNPGHGELPVTVGRMLTAYGWISPLQGSRGMCNYGLIYKTPEDVRERSIRVQPNSVGLSQGLDQVVGIANACHIDITVMAD